MKAKLPFILSGLVALIALFVLFKLTNPHTFHGSVVQSTEPSYNFTLTGADGKSVSLNDYSGKIVFIYFGYTFCPDICPATLANVGQALRKIGEDKASQVQTIMISLDPERDTPEKLAEYVAHFHPSFIGITGSQDELAKVTSLYGIFYEKHVEAGATGYLIDHTATLLVLDRQGYLKLVFPFGVTSEEIADDLEYMLTQ